VISIVGHISMILVAWAWYMDKDDVGKPAAGVFTTYWGIIALGLSGLISLQWFIDDSATKILWVNFLPVFGFLLALALLFGGVGLLRRNPKARVIALAALSVVVLLHLFFVGKNFWTAGLHPYFFFQLLDAASPAIVLAYLSTHKS